MAMNTFDALMAEVNQRISEANTTVSQANAAAAQAREAASSALQEAQAAEEAALQAGGAAEAAQKSATEWERLTVGATTAQAGEEANVVLSQENDAKKLSFVIPRGADGAPGPKGDPGRSGVTFTLSGSKLYITTN